VFYFAYILLCILQTKYGAGMHIADVPTSSFAPFLGITYASLILYNLHQWAIKLSIALLYLRVFSFQPSDKIRNLIYVLIAFICVSYWTFIFIVVFACRPIALAWDKTLEGHCITVNVAFFVNTACSILADLFLIVIVLPQITRLKLGRLAKISTLLVVNLGWLAIIACALRTVKIGQVITVTDFTWHVLDFAVWGGIECSIAMICGTALVIRPLLTKVGESCLTKRKGQPTQELSISVL
jgi:hypothetical protein